MAKTKKHEWISKTNQECEYDIFLELANTVRDETIRGMYETVRTTHVHSCSFIRDYSGLFGTSDILKLKADWLVFPAFIQIEEISTLNL